MTGAEELARALGKPRREGKEWRCLCPAHSDTNPSLSVTEGKDGRLLVTCRAGCGQTAVVDAIHRKGLRLSDGDVNGHQYKGAKGDSKARAPHTWTPIPVPDNVKLPDGGHWPDGMSFPTHRDLGTPSSVVWFHNAAGEVVVGEFRFDIVGLDGKPDKEYRPRVYCRRDDGKLDWQWKGLPHPWPLFGLPGLLAAPSKPVLVVEGARKTERAQELFPDYAVTATLFGATNPHFTDFAPLAERDAISWPDHDEAGQNYANEVARLGIAAGVSSAHIVDVPKNFPPKWDLRDELPAGVTVEQLVELLRSARSYAPEQTEQTEQGYISFGSYRMGKKGLFFISVKVDGSVEEVWLSAPFAVNALTRDPRGDGWGKVLSWDDLDKQQHEWAMPMRMLGGDRGELYRKLLDSGLRISSSPSSRNHLCDYLSAVSVKPRARSVPRLGWHTEADVLVFVLPDDIFQNFEQKGNKSE